MALLSLREYKMGTVPPCHQALPQHQPCLTAHALVFCVDCVAVQDGSASSAGLPLSAQAVPDDPLGPKRRPLCASAASVCDVQKGPGCCHAVERSRPGSPAACVQQLGCCYGVLALAQSCTPLECHLQPACNDIIFIIACILSFRCLPMVCPGASIAWTQRELQKSTAPLLHLDCRSHIQHKSLFLKRAVCGDVKLSQKEPYMRRHAPGQGRRWVSAITHLRRGGHHAAVESVLARPQLNELWTHGCQRELVCC